MAQGRDTISQRISIEGALDVIRQLRDMGAAGEAAISQIRQATEGSAGATSRLGEAFGKIREGFKHAAEGLEPVKEKFNQLHEKSRQFGERMEETANRIIPHYREIAELAFAGSVVGLIAITKEAANYTNELHKVADEVNLNVQKYQELNFVLRATGIEEPRVIATFTRLARSVGAAIVQSREHLKQLSGDLIGDTPLNNVVLGDPKRIATEFARHIREGISDNKDLQDAAKKLHDITVEAFKESGQDTKQVPAIDFFIQRIRKAYTDLTPEAAKIRTELYRFTDLNIPAKTITEVYDRVKEAGDELDVLFRRKLGVAFQDATGQARNLADVFKDVGDKLSDMKESGTQAYYAQLIFNRGFKDFLPLFDNHSHHIKELEEQYRELGIAFTDAEIKAGTQLFQAFSRLNIVLENLKTKFILVFSSDVVDLMNAVNEALKHNYHSIIEFAEGIKRDLAPGLTELFLLIKGEISSDKLAVEWVHTLVRGFTAVKEVIAGIGQAFGFFISLMDRVAILINRVFGTDFTGPQLAAIVIVGQLIGVFGILASIIGVVAAAVGTLWAIFGSVPTAIIAGIAAAAVLIIAYWDEIKSGATGAADWVVKVFTDAFTGLGDRILQELNRWGEAIHNWRVGVGNDIAALWEKFTSFLSLTGQKAGQGTAGGPVVTGFSGGGSVGGSGRGDHVPALLEPEEFVVKRDSVARVGVGFMHALNNGLVGRFSLGGIVNSLRNVSPAPLRMATGGLVPAGEGSRTFHLSIEGRTFRGLSAPAAVHDELLQYARNSSLVSTGPKPSWHGSGNR